VEKKSNKRFIVGRVMSSKMNKAVTVQWETKKMHPKYKKFVIYHKKVKAANPDNMSKEGDIVRISESRPISKEIHWKVEEIISKGSVE